MRRIFIAGFIGVTLAVGAHAAGPAEPVPPSPGALFGGIVQERDVGLFFDYLRNAIQAAVDGREAQPPEELVQRAEAVGEEVKRRGAVAARAVIDAIEQSVREGMREPRRGAPMSPHGI